MATVLLLVIYLTFISLGLPDGVFGGAWPAIRESLHVPIELGGYISLAITSATIASSLLRFICILASKLQLDYGSQATWSAHSIFR